MALATPTLPDSTSVVLRFAGVEVDAARYRLTVNGRNVRVQRLVFNLLLALCEAKGRVLSRDELFSTLWPDGSFPADESLSQLVFKLRTALGPYGGVVITVRQVGVRLEAQVEQVAIDPASHMHADANLPSSADEDADATEALTENATATYPTQQNTAGVADVALAGVALPASAPTPERELTHFRTIAISALTLLALIALVFVLRPAAPAVVSAGFGLNAAEVQASDTRTIETLQRAFAADADGNQSAARVLMETAHAMDAKTPVPAMFLTYWYGGLGDAPTAQHWEGERKRRLGSDTPTYVALLARFLAIKDGLALERLKLESLLLETKPDAALIRLAHAHHHLQRNERAAALKHLRQVDLIAVGRRRAPLVLGDLASLGDTAAVERALAVTGNALDAQGQAYAQARLRASQGRYAEARAAFDRAMTPTQSGNRPDFLRGSALHAALLSAELGDFGDARLRLERSIQALRDERSNVYAWHSLLVLASLPNLSIDESRDLLARLAEEIPEPAREQMCLDVELVAALIGVDPPPALRCASKRPENYARRGGSALSEGLRAQLANDVARARNALARAESEGVRDTALAAYADLLQSRLNRTPLSASVPDPPYPLWHRWALRWHQAQTPER